MLDNPGIIINQLEASTLLFGTWILKDIEKAKDSFTYHENDTHYSYSEYYQILLDEVNTIPTIELSPVIAPGTSRAYLIDLITGLENVMDAIEVVTNKVLFFQSKIKAAKSHLNNLNNSFKAWYLIVMQKELQRFEIKLPAKALDALAESEFNRLVDGIQDDLEGLEEVLALLVDRLKARKALSKDKYKLGQDQANMSLLPQLGAQQGYNEHQTGADLLKERYGLGMELPERGNLVLDEPDPALYPKRKKKSSLKDREGNHLEYEEPETETPMAIETVHEGCWMNEGPQEILIKEEVGEVIFNPAAVQRNEVEASSDMEEITIVDSYETSWEDIGKTPLETIQEAEDKGLMELLQEAKDCGLEILTPVNETPVTSNSDNDEVVVNISAPARARRKVTMDEESPVEQPDQTPAVQEVMKEPEAPVTRITTVKKRRVAFDD